MEIGTNNRWRLTSMKKYIIGMPTHILMHILNALLVFTCLGAIIEYYGGNKNDFSVFLLLALSVFFIWMLFAIQFFCNGYEVKNKEICRYDSFKKKTYSFDDIKAIIISNAYVGGRYGGISPMYMKNQSSERVIRPWFTFVFDDSDLDKTISQNINGELNSFVLEEEWLKDKAFIGFEYNRNVIPQILAEYKGKIFMAKTVAMRFGYSNHIEKIYVIKDM